MSKSESTFAIQSNPIQSEGREREREREREKHRVVCVKTRKAKERNGSKKKADKWTHRQDARELERYCK